MKTNMNKKNKTYKKQNKQHMIIDYENNNEE